MSRRRMKSRKIKKHTLRLLREVVKLVAPPSKIKTSEWADQNRRLPETAAERGQWRTDRTPYLKVPMDACDQPGVTDVIMMFASQVGKTEVLLNVLGKTIDCDPCPCMLVEPTDEFVKDFSKDRLAPMLNDTPCLRKKVREAKAKDVDNTIKRKLFPGGHLTLTGANSPAGLASRPIRKLLMDEIDRFPASAGTEGDPVAIAEKRTTTFWNALRVKSSSPTIKGESRIAKEFEKGTKERWYITCPGCGEPQTYRWGALDFQTVKMACGACGELFGEQQWKMQPGRWIPDAVIEQRDVLRSQYEAKEITAEELENSLVVLFNEPVKSSVRSFHLSSMASPWLSWAAMIQEWKDAQGDPEQLQVFTNTRLAELWTVEGENITEAELEEHRHYYDCDVPEKVRIITAGVDVQANRLELEVVGFGERMESWGIQYIVVPGEPIYKETWDALDEILQRTYRRADGVVLPISCVTVDSGYSTNDVYEFTKSRKSRYIFAVKGVGGPGVPIVGAPTRQGKDKKTFVFPVGTDATKDMLQALLQTEHHGPGYCHWPKELEINESHRGYDTQYFKGLTSEYQVERQSKGKKYHVWLKRSSGIRNEALDCRVYAIAALKILGPGWLKKAAADAKKAGSADITRPAAGRRRRVLSKGVTV